MFVFFLGSNELGGFTEDFQTLQGGQVRGEQVAVGRGLLQVPIFLTFDEASVIASLRTVAFTLGIGKRFAIELRQVIPLVGSDGAEILLVGQVILHLVEAYLADGAFVVIQQPLGGRGGPL